MKYVGGQNYAVFINRANLTRTESVNIFLSNRSSQNSLNHNTHQNNSGYLSEDNENHNFARQHAEIIQEYSALLKK